MWIRVKHGSMRSRYNATRPLLACGDLVHREVKITIQIIPFYVGQQHVMTCQGLHSVDFSVGKQCLPEEANI